VESLAAARDALRSGSYDVLLLDLQLPDGDGLELAEQLREQTASPAIVVVTADGSISRAVEAMRQGAQDFLVKPVARSRLLTTVANATQLVSLKREVDAYRREKPVGEYHGFVGGSLVMQAVYRAIDNVAQSKATVFISGESGTGKEVCANAIHEAGPRRRGPFVPLNCGAIPKDLIESELFGHLKGAFTGAISNRPGAAVTAHGGTLFLDEICEMDVKLQTKLLRFLQTSLIQPIGSNDLREVDVRVICATNRDPVAEVRAGRFREDLYYRLNVLPITLPPLRQRGDDVMLLARSFLTRFSQEEGKRFQDFDDDAAQRLMQHPWPGNVRELQNAVRHVVVLNDAERVTRAMVEQIPTLALGADGLSAPGVVPAATGGAAPPGGGAGVTGVPEGERAFAAAAPAAAMASAAGGAAMGSASTATFGTPSPPASSPAPGSGAPGVIRLGGKLRDIERAAIEGTIAMVDGSVPKAAKLLGVSPSTLYRKLESWGRSPG
jgi:two-component system repressor protein LuxO